MPSLYHLHFDVFDVSRNKKVVKDTLTEVFVVFGSHHFTNVFVINIIVIIIIMGSQNLERSTLIGIIRKTRNVFKILRFCGKRKQVYY